MVFEGLRQRHAACAAALTVAGKLAESRRALLKEMAAFSDLVWVAPAADPYQAMGQLPPLAKMQAAQMTFRVVLAEAEKRLMSARTRLTALSGPEERPGLSHSALLEQVIAAEMKRAAAGVTEAREKVESAITTGTPTVERAKDELKTFARVIGWREYGDLTAKSRELVERIKGWGSAGVQAYFVENEGGVFGPFEFEQRLDLGESSLAVRNTGRTGIELFDLKTGGKLAQSDTGETTIQLPGSDEGVSYETTFRMTARCDDLWMQLEYLTRQISERLGRLSRPSAAPKAESWVRAFDEVFSKPASLVRFTQETREGMAMRDALVTDLKQLARYKERMTTQFLLERYTEMVPRFRTSEAEAQAQLQDANHRIAHIFARSQRDLETGHPMIPTKLAADYDNQTKRRDDAQRKIDRMRRRFDLAVAQIRPRLASAAFYGSATPPAPVAMAPLPQHLLDRAPTLRTEAIGAMVSSLSRALNATLLPDSPVETGESAIVPLDHAAEEGEEVAAGGSEEASPEHSEYISRLPQPQPFIVRPESEEAEGEARLDWVDFNAPSGSPDR
jgi:hypothetical protein